MLLPFIRNKLIQLCLRAGAIQQAKEVVGKLMKGHSVTDKVGGAYEQFILEHTIYVLVGQCGRWFYGIWWSGCLRDDEIG